MKESDVMGVIEQQAVSFRRPPEAPPQPNESCQERSEHTWLPRK